MEEFKNIELRPRIAEALKDAKFETVSDVMHRSEKELSKKLKLSSKDVKELFQCIALEIIKTRPLLFPLTNALKMLNSGEQRMLTTGDAIIDKILGGGIMSCGITEIVGESSAGKTQMCLQLCLTVQMPIELGGLEGGAVYISTEGNVQMLIKRTQQMIRLFKQRHDILKDVNLSDEIKYITVPDLDTQYQVLHLQLPILLSRNKIRLVIIDSIAANFRVAYNSSDVSILRQRSKELCKLGTKFKEISDQFRLPVICVNQVSDLFSKNDIREFIGNKDDNFWEYDYYQRQFLVGKGSKIPALGLLWSNMINSRIMLSRADRTLIGIGDKCQRTITLMMAPYAPRQWGEFYIDIEGIHGKVN
ncbi:16674_t:CDS:2 [Funneliformis caledonium]|uniref:16674_t:CDS:1 n=1 Tax=Funneliformis caledonium TaxID=1117310 RepID=A0A9N8W585_9GLOM|nr:16674_t:CDS:2 [Funneliformis caledonium]